MIELFATHIASLTAGRLSSTVPEDLRIDLAQITTDSRESGPGSTYVAKPGEHSDGHNFIPAAAEAGAVLMIAEREVLDPQGVPYPAVIVKDAVIAMGQLAAEAVRLIREQGEVSVIGITGSAGKTTTKDLLAGILSSIAPTVAPEGSYNGEIGVPLTVFRADFDTRYLVVEMGATGIGHINYLTGLVKPDIGVVLGVGSAHAGEFGGVENIAIAKGEMVEALTEQGIAVLNLADHRVAAMAQRTVAPVLWFAEGGVQPPEGALVVQAWHVSTDSAARPSFELEFPERPGEAGASDAEPASTESVGAGSARSPQRFEVHSGLIGVHHVNNLLAAAAAAWALGLNGEQIAQALDGQKAKSRWRMELTERPDGVTVLNDAYNANPESMRAALRTLAELGRESGRPTRRTWAVLGPMLELGEDSILEHNALGQVVVRLNISRLIVIGAEARAMHIGAINEGSWGDESIFVDDIEAAYEILERELCSGDIVLFKSSRDAGVRYLGDRIALSATASRTSEQEGLGEL
ncbi:UDP-N-acetylmuramoyl-tripeptide--D-alanyl-D-alanine ligase [Psychromicrobium lacuslunae]|uniref:UDP-N-acetylmuramoyl-tripeptide--D-alanyl-D-alanine ligase n=1 Tax=Psychromicrobium lacuslunae TaxID=1618207 RepID=A0A0D4BWL6_9MICC|nr:UDP-N-acetylmuramoyl-tripeptide--D-alanyl-D-alanine ligase [Psychromicrobium lacuslunae]AJT40714.1 UDP-N-acetylmuramoyl-tripeptide--D-alanyl-D-alanine ligase [Psychromicrobium lacuslunae]